MRTISNSDLSVAKVNRIFSISKIRFLNTNSSLLLLPSEFSIFELDPFNFQSDHKMITEHLIFQHKKFLDSPSYEDSVFQGCFCVVNDIHPVGKYPTERAKEYRLVSLNIPTARSLESLFAPETSKHVHTMAYHGVCFVLLFDDQVHLSDLWKPNDLLYLHRPCLSPNNTEPLYGMKVENSSHNHIHVRNQTLKLPFYTLILYNFNFNLLSWCQ